MSKEGWLAMHLSLRRSINSMHGVLILGMKEMESQSRLQEKGGSLARP